ncbi:MAG: S41 family peptidase [Bacteroidales bacterium]|jgi:carboxyl-terminal processing protease|nr:S41 family peptidase [Bacteroidales bacterium]
MNFTEGSRRSLWPAVAGVLFVLLLLTRYCDSNNSRRELEIRAGQWDKLMLILGEIDRNYVDTLDYSKITEATIPLLLEKLDPHSVYLPPQELKNAEEELQGNFDGIGVQFNVPNDTAIIIQVIAGGPSERAGVLSGDRIVEVDGKKVAGVKLDQDSLVSMLKGKSGTNVRVGFKRGDSKAILKLDIKRDKIPVKSVDVSYMVNEKSGYLKLSKFTRTSHKEVLESLETLKEQGMKSLIIDLRGNSGGYLDQALLLSNEFLEKGSLIVYMEGLHRKREDYFADGRGGFKDIKLKVLIDEGSASSSEIFAGAIQDNDRGTIIGRRSFGKGLVQEPIYFSDKSGIRLTVARFYTPTGRSIQKPYRDDYRNDIMERYRHGELTSVDSIRQNDSLKYTTPKGKVVYGGGGITPDLFVPIDTTGVTNFLIKSNQQGLVFRYASDIADQYRTELRGINSLKDLNRFLNSKNLEKGFLEYASKRDIVPTPEEWKSSGYILITQLKALVGRYSPLDDKAYYPIISEIDNVIQVAKQ